MTAGSHTSLLNFGPHHVFPLAGGFSYQSGTSLARGFPFRACAFPLCPHSSDIQQYRNLNLLSIGYAFRPRLRSRLSQRGRAFLWRAWAIGAWDSHPRAATHAGILSSMRSTCPSGHASPLHAMLPYHIPVHSFGVMLSPGKLSAQSHSTSELLRTLYKIYYKQYGKAMWRNWTNF